jgi:hypothetical protein
MRSPISPATMTVSPSRGGGGGHSLAHPILMCAEHPYATGENRVVCEQQILSVYA